MARSVHASRAKFRKAFHVEYSSDEERTHTLAKIIDEIGLKNSRKGNARIRRSAAKQSVPFVPTHYEMKGAAAKHTPPSELAVELVKVHNKKGYGRKS